MGLEIIKKIYEKKIEEREKKRVEILKKTFEALKELSKIVSFKEAYIFGSVTKPYQFGEYSDIDIAFKDFDSDKIFYMTAFLSSYLLRDVNVIDIEKVHFKEKILRESIKWKKD